MNENKKCLVGNDDGDGCVGWIIVIVIAVIVISMIIALMIYGGIFIGLFHSIKNYFVSLKHNVIDSNRRRRAHAR